MIIWSAFQGLATVQTDVGSLPAVLKTPQQGPSRVQGRPARMPDDQRLAREAPRDSGEASQGHLEPQVPRVKLSPL